MYDEHTERRSAPRASDPGRNVRSHPAALGLDLVGSGAPSLASASRQLLQSMLRAAAAAAQGLAEADRAVAALAIDGRTLVTSQVGQEAPVPVGVIRRALRGVASGRPCVLGDSDGEWPPRWQGAARAGVAALAAVPIEVGDAHGCLLVTAPEPRHFSGALLTGLEGVAACAAAALADAHQVLSTERLRLARDLHDTFGQTLTALIFAIDELEGITWASEQRLLARAVRAQGLKAVREMRELIASTARASAGEPEHPRRISQLLKDLPHRGVAVRYQNDLGRQALPAEVAGCLYQVAHEALLNVTRHADAKHVDVQLSTRGRDVHLTVADDGRGFSVADVKSSGWSSFGLRTMRERVAEAGGTLQVDSQPGAGTRITAHLPLGKPLGRRTVVAASSSDDTPWREEPLAARGL